MRTHSGATSQLQYLLECNNSLVQKIQNSTHQLHLTISAARQLTNLQQADLQFWSHWMPPVPGALLMLVFHTFGLWKFH